ncbi:hypothetical protein R3P38DRAFT_332829 [Favolaschia claudopus]|uniref:Uncharacterized protein n=1 Tax=Favolaschia claudopus TaxID=2862362 RepID=A0AAV9ZMC1_9AGAR
MSQALAGRESPYTDRQSLSKFTLSSGGDERRDTILDVASFSAEGFTEFNLDLSCLSSSSSPSPPPSPFASAELPFPPYLHSSAPSSPRRVSFSAEPPPSLEHPLSPIRPSTSPRLSVSSVPSTGPGSSTWPVSRVGHGTPIDRGRRSAWAGNADDAGDEDEVAEDGVLFSTVRSRSIDSAPPPSQRSISPLMEWSYISPPLKERRHSLSLLPEITSRLELPEMTHPNPAAEWATTTQRVVLASSPAPVALEASTSTPELSSSETHETHFESAMQSAEELCTPPDDEERTVVEDRQREELDEGAGLDDSMHAAVNQGLGLIPGGMTWFDVGLLPGPTRDCDTPSVYSCDQQEQIQSAQHIVRPHSGLAQSEVDLRERTTTTTRDGVRSTLWWKRFWSRLRRLRDMLRRRRRTDC